MEKGNGGNLILKLENPLLVGKVIDMAEKVPNTPIYALEKMLLAAINDKDSIVYIDDHEGEIRGFIYASKEFFDGQEVCFVQYCCVKPDGMERYICFELLNKIRIWSREQNLEWIYFMTKRNPRAFQKKYGFDNYSTVMRRKA